MSPRQAGTCKVPHDGQGRKKAPLTRRGEGFVYGPVRGAVLLSVEIKKSHERRYDGRPIPSREGGGQIPSDKRNAWRERLPQQRRQRRMSRGERREGSIEGDERSRLRKKRVLYGTSAYRHDRS